VLARAAERGVNAPPTSSCGRLFDAVASLLDVVDVNSHESEAASALESLASNERGRTYLGDGRCSPEDATCAKVRDAGTSDAYARVPEVIPASDLVRSIVLARVRGDADAAIARRFHRALAHRFADAASRAARQRGLHRIALAGGCFQNRLLLSDIGDRLASAGLTVLAPRRLPPGDGALAVGQAAVTLARWKRGLDPGAVRG
jgi:hydrogenase maturation protein HypF